MTNFCMDIEILRKLKLIEEDLVIPGFLDNQLDDKTYRLAMEKLLQGKIDLLEEGFLSAARNLLGYDDLDSSNLEEEFSHCVGLGLTVNGKVTNGEFFNDLISLLKSRTNTRVQLIEKLCLDGVFHDFNENKEIPEILLFDGKTQPVFDYKNHIFEKVYVEAPLDTDKDNKRDLIEVYIRRPVETQKGMKVPVIYVANPYMRGTNDEIYYPHNVDYDLKVFEETQISADEVKCVLELDKPPEPRKPKGFADAKSVDKEMKFEATTEWYNYFLVRGYAIVFAGGIGTKGSEGLRFCGSMEETISTVAVIDWLNGRANGYSNRVDNQKVNPWWSNGLVGMTGKSYLGTLAIAAATTGVEGLRTIVPQAAISNWYDYYRCNGLNVPALGWQGDDADLLAENCLSRLNDSSDFSSIEDTWNMRRSEIVNNQDRESSNYNRFWDERNYLKNVSKIKASVFIEHGLRDWNVKSKQFHMFWKELEKHDIPRKMLLHQGDHIYIHNVMGIDYNDMMNMWYAYWLYDVKNGVMEKYPNVTIQNNTDTSIWEGYNNWPVHKSSFHKLFVNSKGMISEKQESYERESRFLDSISMTGFKRDKPEDTSLWLDSIVGSPDVNKPFRLLYRGEALKENKRLSGVPEVKFEAALNRKTGILSAMLVDYGLSKRYTLEKEVIVENGMTYGANAGGDDIIGFKLENDPSEYRVITRGWTSVQNRRNNYNKDQTEPGKFYEFHLEMQPTDYVIPKNHEIGLVIYSTDAEATPRPFIETEFKLLENSIQLVIPLGLSDAGI